MQDKASNNWFVDRENEFKEILHLVKESIYEAKTRFQSVKILDTYDLDRILVLDNKIQSAECDEYIYHEALVHPAMIVHEHPKRILILGGGEGATLREVLRHPTAEEVVMVDIDGELVEICRKYLPKWHDGAFDDPRLNLIITDAIAFAMETKEKFDVAICDINDPVEGGPAAAIYTEEFYRSIRGLLNKGGMFATQAVEVFYDEKDLHSVVHRTVSRVFEITESYCEYVPSFGSMWGFLFASNHLSARKVSLGAVRRKLEQRKIEKLRFYDAETHMRLFSLPKMVRDAIHAETRVSTLKNPLHVFPG